MIDGDTIEVLLGSRLIAIRLIGIDTPETVHPTVGVECFGREASSFTKARLEGRSIRLSYDVERTDRYGRVLAYVWVDGALFNETLVREGYAQVSTYPPNVKYVDRFVTAQGVARRASAGLWGSGCDEPEQQSEPAQPAAAAGGSNGGRCDPNYQGACVPRVDHDLDCADIAAPVQVVGSDRHGFDADGDGHGCESN